MQVNPPASVIRDSWGAVVWQFCIGGTQHLLLGIYPGSRRGPSDGCHICGRPLNHTAEVVTWYDRTGYRRDDKVEFQPACLSHFSTVIGATPP